MQQQWQQLQNMRASNRLPHALLFKGAPGAGKFDLAKKFMQALLCLQNNADGTPCDNCHGCRQVLGFAHPDMMIVEPEKAGHAIKVDQIRELNEFVRQSSLQGGYRVIIIHPADAMNVNAANALLKTLEEPARDALLILVSNQSSRLPATILSRCQFIRFSSTAPPADDAILALRQQLTDGLAGNQPDPLRLAESLQTHEPVMIIDIYINWLTDNLRDCVASPGKSEPSRLSALIDYALQTRKLISGGINLNKQLMLEDLFIRWVQYANHTR